MTRPPRPPRRHRTKTSRGRILARRVIALAFVVGVLAILVGSAWAIFRGGRAEEPPPARPVIVLPKALKIIFPEGFTRAQMAERIGEVNEIARDKRNVRPRLAPDRYLALTAGASRVPPQFLTEGKPPHLEGFLFPATYEFTGKTTTRQLLNKQLAAFRRSWSKVNLRYARTKNLTSYDVLVIASMIEKEVIAPEERALVSAVIYNRLKAGMTLGIDATIRYGLGVPPTESLRESHLADPTPYNTRIHAGLPPTPIANPGLASMQAAAHPARVNYLYFVRKPDKKHHFFTASKREFDEYLATHGY
jgi:uncharacterized YceG family protein